MLFAMCGYYAYARAVFDRARRSRALAALALARVCRGRARVLVKGPIGVIAIAGPLAIDALWRGAGAAALARALGRRCRCSLAACAAWPLALYLAGGEQAARPSC
jgi:hypothetical protein